MWSIELVFGVCVWLVLDMHESGAWHDGVGMMCSKVLSHGVVAWLHGCMVVWLLLLLLDGLTDGCTTSLVVMGTLGSAAAAAAVGGAGGGGGVGGRGGGGGVMVVLLLLVVVLLVLHWRWRMDVGALAV